MKIFTYILAIYLVLLSVIPCCAFDSCPDDKVEQATNHENNDKDCGNCSPFFSCEGCATVAITHEVLPLSISPVPIPSVYTFHIPQPLTKIDYDFWQPPKIS